MRTEKQIADRLAKFANTPDAQFIRAAISGARYLDKLSRAMAVEALKRFDRLHPEAK